jgi:hypothetical protein
MARRTESLNSPDDLLRAALRAEGTSLRCMGRSGKLSGPGAVVVRNKKRSASVGSLARYGGLKAGPSASADLHRGWGTFLLRKEAEREIIREWVSLPENERQTEHQAAQFALEMKRKYVFDYVGGDRYQEIRRMMLRHTGRAAA